MFNFGNMGTIWSEIGLDTRKLDTGLMAANTKLAAADKSISAWGNKLTANSTKLIATGGIMAGAVTAVGVASIKMAKDFDTSMRNVNSISKLSEDRFKTLSAEVLKLSTKLPQSAKTLADGLYDIASSGFQGADGLKVLEASAKAASAGMTTTAVSAKGITAVLNAYGFSADKAGKVSDIMFKTVDKGVITFEELSSTIGESLGMAKAANISFEELSGSIAFMTTKGLGAAEANTAVSRLMTSMLKPTDELAQVFKDAGYESGEMALKQLGLAGTLKLVQDATGGSITKMLDLLPEIRAVKGANALLGSGYEELTNYLADFNDTLGSTDVALKEQAKSLDYQINLLKNNVSAIAIALGSELVPGLSRGTAELSKWIGENAKAITGMLKLGGATVGTTGLLLVLLGVIGKVRGAIVLLNSTSIGIGGAGIIGGITAMIGVLAMYINSIYHASDANKEIAESNKILEQSQKDLELAEKNRIAGQKMLANETFLSNATEEQSQALAKEAILTDEKRADATAELIEKEREQAEAIKDTTKETALSAEEQVKAIVTQKQNAATLEMLQNNYGLTAEQAEEYAKAEGLLKSATELTTDAIEDNRAETEKLADAKAELIQKTNDLYSALFNEWLLNVDIKKGLEEATKAYAEYIKTQKPEDLEAWVRIIDSLANTQIPELINKTGALTDEERGHLEGMQDQIDKAHELGIISPQEWTTISKSIKDRIQNSIMQDMTDMYNMMDELNEKEVNPKIGLDTSEFNKKYNAVTQDMNRMLGAYGSVTVKGYDKGGIIGQDYAQPILRAASGMNVPQSGRAVPIMAHEYEVIANTSQQKNVADWFWNFINNPPQIGSSGPIEITVPVILDGETIGRATAKYQGDGVDRTLRGQGIR